MKLSEEIKKLMNENVDLTIVGFAAEAKVHTQTVYNALNERPLKPRSINKLSHAVNRLSEKLPTQSKATA